MCIGVRHLSRFYNTDYLASQQLLPRYLSPGLKINSVENAAVTAEKNTHDDCMYPPAKTPVDEPSLRSVVAAKSNSPPASVYDFVDDP